MFHFCALGDASGHLTSFSFLCPNGTIFNQQYFICDWWFNVDCSIAESLYSINDEIAAEAAAYVRGRGAVNVQNSNSVNGIASQSSGSSGKRITGNAGTGNSNQRSVNQGGNRLNKQPARRGDGNFLSRYGPNGK
jgi:hypothetical protein